MPLDDPKQAIPMGKQGKIPQNRELVRNILMETVQNLAPLRPLTAHDMGTDFNYSQVTLSFLFVFFHLPLFAIHCKVFGFRL